MQYPCEITMFQTSCDKEKVQGDYVWVFDGGKNYDGCSTSAGATISDEEVINDHIVDGLDGTFIFTLSSPSMSYTYSPHARRGFDGAD